MYPTFEAALFSQSNGNGLAGYSGVPAITDQELKFLFDAQQRNAERLNKTFPAQLASHHKYAKNRVEGKVTGVPAGETQYKKYLNYYESRNFDIKQMMPDVKRVAPHLWKPEYERYIQSSTPATTDGNNLPATVPASGFQKYLTKRNLMIGGGVLVGGVILYSFLK